ncbi:MAG: OmpH family outer membrane protein [Polyangiaceae bacterium]
MSKLRDLSFLAIPVAIVSGILSGRLAVAADPPAAGSATPAKTAAPAMQFKVAVVDIQRAARETEDGLRAQATLRKVFERRQGELAARQDDLQRKREELQKQSQVLSQQAMQRALQDWERQMLEVQNLFNEAQRDLQKREAELTNPIFAKVSAVTRQVAQSEGYDAILERQAVPFARSDLDLTDLIIQQYNQQYNGGASPPAASNAPSAPTAPAPASSK